jgi:hypothetical protein
MSCTTSAAWSRPVSSPCYTEHGQRCGVVLSGRITIVAMSKSGQMGLRCTVKSNCSDMSARHAGASITRDRALDTYEPSCVVSESGQSMSNALLWLMRSVVDVPWAVLALVYASRTAR